MNRHELAFARDEALTRVDGDLAVFFEIFEIFLGDYPSKLKAIEGAIAQCDSSEINTIAHSLKSALGNLGAMAAHHAALSLELAGKGKQIGDFAGLFKDLTSQIEEFIRAVEEFRRGQSKPS